MTQATSSSCGWRRCAPFEQLNLLKNIGTDEDKAFLAGLEAERAAEIEQVAQMLNGIADGTFVPEGGNNSSIINETTTQILQRAEVARLDSIKALNDYDAEQQRLSVAMIFAFSLGLPLIVIMFFVTRLYERKDHAHELEVTRLKEAALTDGLTGLLNQRSFQEDLRRAIAHASRTARPLSLAMIDIDNFKEINDRAGHAHGDLVLSQFASVTASLRSHDRCYRIGGDEFALILQDTDAVGAFEAVERLRTAVAEGVENATISGGISTTVGGPSQADELCEHADAALYEAKRRGKNQVVIYEASFNHANAA